MKVAVIGGGSTYTPELVRGFLERMETLPIQELWLMDDSVERLAVVGGLARRMVHARGSPFEVMLSQDRRAALDRASYVVTQLRVGKLAARREDEYLGHRHGLIGQETTGVGGMACALRTIPVMLSIAQDMMACCPDALLVNFTNPAGLITEALARYAPGLNTVGLCNVPITAKLEMCRAIGHPGRAGDAYAHAELDTLGLNHLTWHRGLVVDGKDRWPAVLDVTLRFLEGESTPEWEPGAIRALGMIPNDYLQYYYHTGRKLAQQAAWPPSRAEQVMAIEQDLLTQYGRADVVDPPQAIEHRGGAHYSTAATGLIESHHNDRHEVHVVNGPHGGAVAGWPEDWVLELPCRVSRAGIQPIPAQPLPGVCFGLIAQVKAYELLTVEAAVHGDRDAAYLALLAHPLGPPADRVPQVLDDMLSTNRAYLPLFWQT